METLPQNQYALLRPLFAPFVDHLSPQAVLAGRMPGSVLVDALDRPTVALLLCAEGTYLTSACPPVALAPDRVALLRETLRNCGHDIYLFVSTPDWEAHLADLFDGVAPLKTPRRSYALHALAGGWHRNIPESLILRQLDGSFFDQPALANYAPIADWAINNWGSVAQFVADGFGFGLLHGDMIVSWCLADCISGDRCEIGIHTDPTQRRQGFATIVVAASVAFALERGITTVGWQCAEDNRGSQAVAEKVGFVHRSSCVMYWGHRS